jgi:hypothetical protein
VREPVLRPAAVITLLCRTGESVKRGEFLIEKLEARFEKGPIAGVCGGPKILEHSDTGMLQTLPFALDGNLLNGCADGCRSGTPVGR